MIMIMVEGLTKYALAILSIFYIVLHMKIVNYSFPKTLLYRPIYQAKFSLI